MISWVLFLGIGLIVGVIAGLYFARLDDVSNRQKNQLQQKLHDTEQQLQSYQAKVTEHFLTTASLVNSMTESYKAVHEHLAQGASELCDAQVTVAQLDMPATKMLESSSEPQTGAGAAKDEEASTQNAAQNQPDIATTPDTMERQPSSEATAAEGDQPTQLADSQVMEESKVSEGAQTEEQDQPDITAVQPPSTPESLHVEENDSSSPQPLEEAEKTAPANVSRMVH